MIENAARQGERLMAALGAVRSPSVKEVRGRGLMVAVELHPDAGGARTRCEALQRRGLLCKETHDHTIRIAPPLIVTDSEVDWIADQFAEVL